MGVQQPSGLIASYLSWQMPVEWKYVDDDTFILSAFNILSDKAGFVRTTQTS